MRSFLAFVLIAAIDSQLCGSEVQPVFGAMGVSVVVTGYKHV